MSGYLNFNVDFDGTDTWQRRLTFLPVNNGTIVQINGRNGIVSMEEVLYGGILEAHGRLQVNLVQLLKHGTRFYQIILEFVFV